MARRNLLRSCLAAALSVVAVMAAGLLTVRPGVAGAADSKFFEIGVSDAGFNPPVVEGVNVGDVLVFELNQTTENHTVTFEDPSACPGRRGAEPCWPELRFDQHQPGLMCTLDGRNEVPGWRCLIVEDPGKTVRYHDYFNPANVGEIRVVGEPTTTTGPSTTTTTAPSSTTTTTMQAPTTTTTRPQTTTTTAPAQIHPFVIPDPPPTTSTMAPAAPVAATDKGAPPAPVASKGKDNKDKGKAKAAGAETPTTAAPPPSDAVPPDSVFDPAALTPGPVMVPDTPGDPADGDGVNLESSAVMNLLDHEPPANHLPMLVALGALAFLLVAGGVWRWFTRASRYDPA